MTVESEVRYFGGDWYDWPEEAEEALSQPREPEGQPSTQNPGEDL